ncbi:four helix bundle protein [Telluribacter humicola]|uniref:four helix bundle protein n=1 Tax=Telluribacter humicola TaxID=1720261 RepID=UPI0035B63EED
MPTLLDLSIIALGSAHEVKYLIQLCYDLKYIEESIYKDTDSRVNLAKRKLYHLEKKINSKS